MVNVEPWMISYGPWGLVGLFFILLATGRVIPRSTHDSRVKDKDELIDKLQKALDKRDEQLDKLYTQNELIVTLLEGLKLEAKQKSGSV